MGAVLGCPWTGPTLPWPGRRPMRCPPAENGTGNRWRWPWPPSGSGIRSDGSGIRLDARALIMINLTHQNERYLPNCRPLQSGRPSWPFDRCPDSSGGKCKCSGPFGEGRDPTGENWRIRAGSEKPKPRLGNIIWSVCQGHRRNHQRDTRERWMMILSSSAAPERLTRVPLDIAWSCQLSSNQTHCRLLQPLCLLMCQPRFWLCPCPEIQDLVKADCNLTYNLT